MPLLQVESLRVRFKTEEGYVEPLDGVSFEIEPGEVMGLVGETGSGKSVTAQAVMGLLPFINGEVTAGRIIFMGKDLLSFSEDQWQKYRGAKLSLISQNPMTSLDPVYRVGEQIVEGMLLHLDISKPEARRHTIDLMASLQIPNPERVYYQYPHQLSGGQKQRVVIARALALTPEFVILDEPTAALDVSVQAQVILLLQQLREKFNLTYLFISHDLALVDYFCYRAVVMYLGRVMEILPANKISTAPRHPYTKALADSVFIADPAARRETVPIEGEVPSPFNLPPGCVFGTRCPYVREVCRDTPPPLTQVAEGEYVACHFPLND